MDALALLLPSPRCHDLGKEKLIIELTQEQRQAIAQEQNPTVVETPQDTAQFSTDNSGMSSKSESLLTTTQFPNANAMAAICMSIC
jgi:hypothetical protein